MLRLKSIILSLGIIPVLDLTITRPFIGRDVGELVMGTNAYFFELEADLDGAETPSNPVDNTQAAREETGIGRYSVHVYSMS